MNEESSGKLTGDKKKVANVLLFTGFIQIFFHIFLLPRVYGNIGIMRKIICIFIVFPGWFISLLSNSGMSAVPSKRTLYDVIIFHQFQIPGFVIINLIYYFGKKK